MKRLKASNAGELVSGASALPGAIDAPASTMAAATAANPPSRRLTFRHFGPAHIYSLNERSHSPRPGAERQTSQEYKKSLYAGLY
jgi:hypothetical protein